MAAVRPKQLLTSDKIYVRILPEAGIAMQEAQSKFFWPLQVKRR